jgi:hypothetical protein
MEGRELELRMYSRAVDRRPNGALEMFVMTGNER